jgi:hypothetical protein
METSSKGMSTSQNIKMLSTHRHVCFDNTTPAVFHCSMFVTRPSTLFACQEDEQTAQETVHETELNRRRRTIKEDTRVA